MDSNSNLKPELSLLSEEKLDINDETEHQQSWSEAPQQSAATPSKNTNNAMDIVVEDAELELFLKCVICFITFA